MIERGRSIVRIERANCEQQIRLRFVSVCYKGHKESVIFIEFQKLGSFQKLDGSCASVKHRRTQEVSNR